VFPTLTAMPFDASALHPLPAPGAAIPADPFAHAGGDFAAMLGSAMMQGEAQPLALAPKDALPEFAPPAEPAAARIAAEAAVPVRSSIRPFSAGGKILPPDMTPGTNMPPDPLLQVTDSASGECIADCPVHEPSSPEPAREDVPGSGLPAQHTLVAMAPQPGYVRPVAGAAKFAAVDAADQTEPAVKTLPAALPARPVRIGETVEPPATAVAPAPGFVPPPVTAPIAPMQSSVLPHSPDMTGSVAASPVTDLEGTVEQLTAYRDAARSSRPELTVRHSEFGMVNLRVEASGGATEWRALLTSRDPGFVPAVQAALAERAVAASSDSPAHNGAYSGGRGGESSSFGQGSGQPSHGSSPGSGQSASQPFAGQSANSRRGHAAVIDKAADDRGASAAMTGGLFA
jgi:hypothetical protein